MKVGKLTPPSLRDYQKFALKKVSEAVKQGLNPLLIKLATGGGKTVVASQILYNCSLAGKRAIMICDRIELINQTSNTLLRYGIDHGVIQSSHPRENFKKSIQVASVQTMARREFMQYDVVIIDEAHTLHRTHIRFMEWLKEINPKALIIGLSATPFTKGLGKHFKKCIPISSTKELIELGFLCKPVVYAPSSPDLEQVKVVAGDYDASQLEHVTNTPKLVGDIVEHWIKLAFDKPTICFATSIAHSQAIVDEFKKRGVEASHIDAYTDDATRKRIITAFRNGAIKVLSSVDILSKGFDYPGAECAILARPTKSLALYVQQGGRVLRISPETGKKGCLILDHAGNTERHGFLTDDTPEELDMGVKSENVAPKKEKEERKPVVCPKCSFVKNSRICENCQHEFVPKNTVESLDGYLVRIDEEGVKTKQKAVKDILLEDPIHLYGQLKQLCAIKGWKEGRAYFMYKDLTDQEPPAGARFAKPQPVTTQLQSYLKHVEIRKRKSNDKKAA